MAGESFPRGRRLLRHADFQDVYRRGQRQFSAHITVFHLSRPATGNGPRVGVAVAASLGGAVERNRIKRRLRSAVRQHLHHLTRTVDVVIQAKKSVLSASFLDLKSEVQKAFSAIESGESKRNSSQRAPR